MVQGQKLPQVALSYYGRPTPPNFTPDQLLTFRFPYIYCILPNLGRLNNNVADLKVVNSRFTDVNGTE